jgi:predicted O-methyltransferase YrrM
MDERLTAYLEELYRRGGAHDAQKADRLERLRNLEPDTARLLAVLVRATRAKRVLELGTSNGYSTIWLADAARSVGGRVLSVDLDARRIAEAGEHLAQVHLEDIVELRSEDAARTLAGSEDASWQMVFLDAERPDYCGYWPDLLRVLAPGGLLVVDNVLSHAGELEQFRELVSSHPGVSEAVVPTGAGALLVVREI